MTRNINVSNNTITEKKISTNIKAAIAITIISLAILMFLPTGFAAQKHLEIKTKANETTVVPQRQVPINFSRNWKENQKAISFDHMYRRK